MTSLTMHEILEELSKHIRVFYDHTEPDGTFNCKIGGLEEAAAALHARYREKQPRGTGWWVMVKQIEDEWLPVACVSEENEAFQDTWCPKWDQIIPIANPEDMPEWGGF